jgi:methylated-DNA-[protein]-cysteine S-methyltransferase
MSQTTYFSEGESPLGLLSLTSDGEVLTGVYLSRQRHGPAVTPQWQRRDDVPIFAAVREQLAAYFRGERNGFDLPLAPHGTEFQQRVWEELSRIPYGCTISYGELARRIGNDRASRAVGLANGRNPIAIIIPCHRVIGADGSLTGYGGGMHRKQALLAFEAAVLHRGPHGMPPVP